MKTYPITAQTVLSAVKRQWKCFLAVVLAFTVLGAAGGFLYAGRGSSESGGGEAQALPEVEFDTLPYTQSYYSDCLQALDDSCYLLEKYVLTAFEALEEPDEAQLSRRTALDADRREFQQTVLLPLRYTLQEAGSIYVPAEFLDDLTSQYESRLATVRMNLLAAEAAAETVRQMAAPNFENGNYNNLLSQAAEYGALLKDQASYERILDRLKNESGQIRRESRQVEEELNKAAQALNALLEDAAQFAGEIGETAGVSIVLQPNATSYDILANHTYRASSFAEAFAVMTLFCVLAGICAGGFLAVCREAGTASGRKE